MKHLYIVRHAKSDWSNQGLIDYERPLHKRGKTDISGFIPLIAKKVTIDRIVTSGSKRTMETAHAWAQALTFKESDIEISNALYEASVDTIIDTIKNTSDTIRSLMIVGHNPGLTEFVNQCGYNIENIPTSGIVCFEYTFTDWGLFTNNQVKFLWYEYPKKYK